MKISQIAVWSLILSLCMVPSLNAGFENGENVQSVEPSQTTALIEKALPNLVLLGGVAFSVQQALNGNWSLPTSVLTSLASAAAAYAIYARPGWFNQESKESADLVKIQAIPQIESLEVRVLDVPTQLPSDATLSSVKDGPEDVFEAAPAKIDPPLLSPQIESPEVRVLDVPPRVPSDDSLSIEDEPEDVFEAAPVKIDPPLLRFSVEIPKEIIDARKIKSKKKRPNKPLVGAENKKPQLNTPNQKSEAHASPASVAAAEAPAAPATHQEIVRLFDAAFGKGFSDGFLRSVEVRNLDRSFGIIDPEITLRNLYHFLGAQHIEEPHRFLIWSERKFREGRGAGLSLYVPFALKTESGMLLVKFSEEFLSSILGFRDVQGHFINLDTLWGISSKALRKWRAEAEVKQIPEGRSIRFTRGYEVKYQDWPYVVAFGYEKVPMLITAYEKAR